MTMVWNIILYGIMMVAVLTVFFTCGLLCVKLFRPEPEIAEDEEDDVDFLAVPRRLMEDVEPSYETAHITRDSLRFRDSSEDLSYDEIDMYELSSSDSLTSSGKGYTTDDHTDSNHTDADKSDENDASGSQDDSGIKSNPDDNKPIDPEGKNGDN